MTHSHWMCAVIFMVEYLMGRQNYFRAKSVIEFILLFLLAVTLYIKWMLPKQGDFYGTRRS